MKALTQFKSLHAISHSMFALQLEKPADFTYDVGQFITITIYNDEGKKLFRSYSLASHPDDEHLECIIKFPEGSRAQKYFTTLKKGDELEIKGPYGNYVLQKNDKQKIHIVTGAGIGPNFSMLKAWEKSGYSGNASMYFGIQGKENVPYFEKFIEWKNNGLDLKLCITREPVDNEISFEGRVLTVLENSLDNYQEKEFYICGLPEMVTDAVEFLREKGVLDENIFYEEFTAAYR